MKCCLKKVVIEFVNKPYYRIQSFIFNKKWLLTLKKRDVRSFQYKKIKIRKTMKINISSIVAFILIVQCYSTQAYDAKQLIEHVKTSLHNASEGKSKLTSEVLKLYNSQNGASGIKERHLLNNLCSLPGTRYLEVGVFHGSTFTAALFNNNTTILDAIAVDNWSQFGNNKESFLNKANKVLMPNSFRFIEQDAFSIDLEKNFSHPITIYFYDGDHSYLSQYKAFTYFNPIFADIFIAVVDDWNDKAKVQKGTRDAFKNLGYTILFEQELSAQNGDVNNWWYGVYVAVIKK